MSTIHSIKSRKQFAPVLIFAYKRLSTLKRTVEALKKNAFSSESEIFIFSDGAKIPQEQMVVLEVRTYLASIEGFKKITIVKSDRNKGLANSIIDGVTQVVNAFGKAIILEDDLITSTNFLAFMNSALDFYRENKAILSISGYSIPLKSVRVSSHPYDTYFTMRSSSWGWATWSEKWQGIDWSVDDFVEFSKNKKLVHAFNRVGSDLFGTLKKYKSGKIDSWAVRYCFHQFQNKLYSVYPITSKVKNIGFDNNATNTKDKFNRFKTSLDTSGALVFNFEEKIILDRQITRAFRALYGIRKRIFAKLINTIIH